MGHFKQRHRFLSKIIKNRLRKNKKCPGKNLPGQEINLTCGTTRIHIETICTHCVQTYAKHCNGCPPSHLIVAVRFALKSPFTDITVTALAPTAALLKRFATATTLSHRFAWNIDFSKVYHCILILSTLFSIFFKFLFHYGKII